MGALEGGIWIHLGGKFVEREGQSEPGEMWIRSFPWLVSIVHPVSKIH